MTVWYAAYGSNLASARFSLYLQGGELDGVADRARHAGARDPSPALDDRRHEVGHQLRFARHSSRWGGAPAFLDPRPDSGRAVLRVWRVTLEQFEDVAAQENGMSAGSVAVDLDRLVAEGRQAITDRWYGDAVFLGELDGSPVVTFTSTVPAEPTAPPSSSYLSTIVGGMVELGLDADEIADALLPAPGVAPAWTRSSIHALL